LKSILAFKTISEVSSDLGIPQHILRFWEKRFPQIKPMTRAGGRRYYRPSDIKLLRTINKLLYVDSYTIKGVQKLFKENGVSHVISLFDSINKNYNSVIEIEKDKIKNNQAIIFKDDLFDDAHTSLIDHKINQSQKETEKSNSNTDKVNNKIDVVKAIKELRDIRDILVTASQ
jgi:DNA-binding transcriptional MerR regulator|tara:strand:+ start:56 stop:574 length:519 start_codon:yes stop_codon:yes gene_type:complete